MKLKRLLSGIKVLNAFELKNVTINCVSNNTKEDMKDGLYVCLKGEKVDGHSLKEEAKKRGAVAFVVEEFDYDFDGLQILVEDTRQALSILAKNFYGKKIPKVIGVTGTNGKTTTTCLVAHILKECGKKVGLIGTEGIFFENKKINLHMTTPDPIELFKVLGQMSKSGVEYAVMEVSAHAIALKKVSALDFYVEALTNITEDHLDFFKTLDNYRNTKMNFINQFKGIKIVNIDDKYGCKIASKSKNVFTYSMQLPADAMATNLKDYGKKFECVLSGEKFIVNSNLIGNYNVQNILCAILICKKIGISSKQIVNSVNTFKPVEGRLNVFKRNEVIAIIDFAHTPDALENLLSALRKVFKGRLITLFGCGGNRESEKRPTMGAIAEKLSDYVYITNDNPRFEKPDDIAMQIVQGIKGNNYQIIHNREQAIKQALDSCVDGDVIVICGKGAEDYMEINGQKHPYSDKSVLINLGFIQE